MERQSALKVSQVSEQLWATDCVPELLEEFDSDPLLPPVCLLYEVPRDLAGELPLEELIMLPHENNNGMIMKASPNPINIFPVVNPSWSLCG